MKKLTRIVCIILSAVLLAGTAAAADCTAAEAAAGLETLGGGSARILNSPKDFPAGTSGCDWAAIALALAGREGKYSAYLNELQKYVEQEYAARGSLSRYQATEYHRIALAVRALGGNPENFGKKPDGTVIDLIAEGTYDYAGDSLGTQGLNGWIWALIALDSGSTEIPAEAKYQRSDMLAAILSAQEPDGGFGLLPGSSDIDITAMALQALGPYREQYAAETEAALAYLASQMSGDCGFVSYGAENAESLAQVLLALCALGIDPAEDARFRRGENSLLDRLTAFARPDGSFSHTLADDEGNMLATSQVVFALAAVSRLRAGEPWVFSFEDYEGPAEKAGSNIVYWVTAAAAVTAGGAAWIIGKRKKNG